MKLRLVKADGIWSNLNHNSGYRMGKHKPTSKDLIDIYRGIEVIKGGKSVSLTLSVFIQDGLVLATRSGETTESTEDFMKHCKEVRYRQLGSDSGGVLVSNFDIDNTDISHVIESKMSGVASYCNGSRILDYERAISDADRHGIFFIELSV